MVGLYDWLIRTCSQLDQAITVPENHSPLICADAEILRGIADVLDFPISEHKAAGSLSTRDRGLLGQLEMLQAKIKAAAGAPKPEKEARLLDLQATYNVIRARASDQPRVDLPTVFVRRAPPKQPHQPMPDRRKLAN